ncbi:SRPBCC family protein [Sphingosinicella rhizophila]|uniref:SRPBCC family protein n=1 Tax=Sphingosinicella rhizophila TaxID=3050082 RepID=A0ABU3Q405_9SPHN|nr:SRPBCC family protein [Sphingosinicella sp. GR2756]MDT9598007.1 SRPBCC family protein [Sphingosinicella sp. GR2756]
MKTGAKVAVMVALSVAAPAQAEVKAATTVGFELESKIVVAATPGEAYAMLGRIGDWWNPAHSYSGEGANLHLDLKAGGCFCETLQGGGSVEHMRVVFVQPGSVLRLQGGLGPLQTEGATGTLTWSLKPAIDGTEIVQTYVFGGYVRGGADKIAPIVDQVMAEQLDRLRAKLNRVR